MSVALQAQGRLHEAAICLDGVLLKYPRFAPAHNDRGVIARKLGHLDTAVVYFQRALELNPGFAPALNNLGWLRKTQGRLDEAAIHFERALAIRSDYGEACIGIGQIRLTQGRHDDASMHFQRALEIDPNYPAAHFGLGYVLRVRGQLEAAEAAFQRAIQLRPNFSSALAQLVYLLHTTCQWETLKKWAPKLEALTTEELNRGTPPGDGPVGTMRYSSDLSRHLHVARAWSRQLSQHARLTGTQFQFIGRSRDKERLRIGYASGTFGDHPVGHYVRGMIARHDRRKFDVLVYSYTSDDGSAYRAATRSACDVLVDISSLSPIDAATKIHSDEIDILVDLDGYTPQGRPGIFALRPAPVQVAYLGFVATTGADFLDYLVADKTVVPDQHKTYYTEHIVYLPGCFAVDSTSAQVLTARRADRTQHGLPDDVFVFCCFNLPSKIDAVIFDRWMNIMRAVPSSVLWLYRDNALAEENLRSEATARGVDERRLVFAERVNLAEHIDRIRLADLALDTCLYNGGATTSNALAAGVPVVTLLGSRFATRMSASMVGAVGLPQLVTHTLDDYEEVVLELVRNPDKRSAMRRTLESARHTSPLFDAQRFARNLEKAFAEMWKIFSTGQDPRHIEVAEGI